MYILICKFILLYYFKQQHIYPYKTYRKKMWFKFCKQYKMLCTWKTLWFICYPNFKMWNKYKTLKIILQRWLFLQILMRVNVKVTHFACDNNQIFTNIKSVLHSTIVLWYISFMNKNHWLVLKYNVTYIDFMLKLTTRNYNY